MRVRTDSQCHLRVRTDSQCHLRVRQVTIDRDGGIIGTVVVTYEVGLAAAPGALCMPQAIISSPQSLSILNKFNSRHVVVAVSDDVSLAAGSEFCINMTAVALSSGAAPTQTTTGPSPHLAEGSTLVRVPVPDALANGHIGFLSATASGSEGQTLSLSVARTGGVYGTATVGWSVVGQTADVFPTSGTLTFADGEALQSISVAVVDDALPEVAETVVFALRSVLQGTATINTQANASTLTISSSDDPAGILAFAEASRRIAYSDPVGTVTMTVVRTAGSFGVISLQYRTVDGTAQAGTDYIGKTGILTFDEGVRELDITVTIIDTGSPYTHRAAFQVEIFSAIGGAKTGPHTLMDIQIDSCHHCTVFLDASSTVLAVVEPSDNTTFVTLDVLREPDAYGAADVAWVLERADGNSAASDFVTLSGIARLQHGVASTQLQIQVQQLTFYVRCRLLSRPQSASAMACSVAVG